MFFPRSYFCHAGDKLITVIGISLLLYCKVNQMRFKYGILLLIIEVNLLVSLLLKLLHGFIHGCSTKCSTPRLKYAMCYELSDHLLIWWIN